MASSSCLCTIFLMSLAFCFSFTASTQPITFSVYHVSRFTNYDPSIWLDEHQHLDPTVTSYHRSSLYYKGMGEYVVEVRVGYQTMHLLLDIGSELIWWQCLRCNKCYKQDDPIFDTEFSPNYSPIMCASPLCDIEGMSFFCRITDISPYELCGFSTIYADGSQAEGILSQDRLSTIDRSFSTDIYFGCAYNNDGKFDGHYAGIMGFGWGDFSFPSQINSSKFSFCLVRPGSPFSSTLFLDTIPSFEDDDDVDDTIFVNMYRNNHVLQAYYVEFHGIAIGGEMVPISPERWRIDGNGNYGVLLDTGAGISKLPPEEYAIFRDAFRKEVRKGALLQKPDNNSDTCYKLPNDDIDYFFPRVHLYLGNDKQNRLTLNQDQVVVYNGGSRTYCLAFAPFQTNNWKVTIIGSYQLQTTRLSFDRDEMTIRFTRSDCE